MSPIGETATSALTETSTATTTTEPTPSPVPVQAASVTTPIAYRPHPKPGYPICKLRLECRDLTHEGAEIFISNNNITEDLLAAVAVVLSILYKPSQSNSHIPGTRSVTLILEASEGVAYTRGSELDNDHKEIHFSLDYISKIPTEPPSRRRNEIQGVLVHEMVHCWQWNGHGTAPGGLIEGIADFVRLKAGLSPPHWKKQKKDNWDLGYQHTGYFLDWIESKYGIGSVRRVNEALMNRRYDEEAFWMGLFGKQVKELRDDYCTTIPQDAPIGIEKAQKEPEKAQKEPEKAQKEPEKAQKEPEKARQKSKDQLEKVLD